ncbi:hypothetical protein [Nocardia sp. NBC_01009]|uniref:hypothetical protein n=1 Tax=Nocardia sp. NBC_01009 TaxID=2975996 RepID=UPI00386F52F3|nr:hypothetical protein OHA42_13120 [Nocardia sp. NBC_01009]
MTTDQSAESSEMNDPLLLDARRARLLERVRELRGDLEALGAEYQALPGSGVLVDTEGVGALTTPGYCIAGAVEVFEEAQIELDAAADALDRAGRFTTRLRPVVFD